MVNFAPAWIADANYGLAADIEHTRMLFPCRNKNNASDDEIEDVVWAEMDEQIKEMCLIVVTATKTGVQHFDLPEVPTSEKTTISTKQRKDRYSALLLSSYASRTYISEGQMEFTPIPGDWVDNF